MEKSVQQHDIPQWLAKKSVFITGVTGFVGKVLLEKLLRTCPEINRIYVLLRTRRGQAPEDRLKVLTSVPLFDLLKKQDPDSLKKIHIVNGDLTLLQAGISESDKEQLVKEVSVVFHVAASVRVDHELLDVIKLNTRGTRDILFLAKQMKQLEVFVHVSTAYTNSDLPVIKEEIKSPSEDWQKMIEMIGTSEEEKLKQNPKKILGNLPNTYLFSKRLAEQLVYDHRHEVPVVIYRPSMVSSTMKEPFPGWVDNMASVTGIAAGVSKGVVRVYPGPINQVYDFVPADVTVNGMIIAAWVRANDIKSDNNTVYNSTTERADIGEMLTIASGLWENSPMADIMWEPYFISCTNNVMFHILWFFLHIIPGFLIDFFLRLTGNKPRLMRLYDLLYKTFANMRSLMYKTWEFQTDNFQSLTKYLSEKDKEIFWIENVKHRTDYMVENYHGMRQYIFKEPKIVPKSTILHRQRIYWIEKTCRLIILGLIVWFLAMSPVPKYFYNSAWLILETCNLL